jgi:hypothetical protein
VTYPSKSAVAGSLEVGSKYTFTIKAIYGGIASTVTTFTFHASKSVLFLL